MCVHHDGGGAGGRVGGARRAYRLRNAERRTLIWWRIGWNIVFGARASYQAHLCAPDWLLPFFMLRDERRRRSHRQLVQCRAAAAAAARSAYV